MRSDLTILAIDDDANYLMLIEHAWRSTGINNPFQCVTSGHKAIEYLTGGENIPTGVGSRFLD